jgi:GTP-binding protein HflX
MKGMNQLDRKTDKAILVGAVLPGMRREQEEDSLDELAMLADTAGAAVAGRLVQERRAVDASTFVGKGKVHEITRLAEDTDATVVLVDEDLSPVQLKNLEKQTGRRVLDRSMLIFDIFARRARSREAKTQVELARLEYMLPRLTRQWTHLERQEGAVGTRGPGETQLETDRRAIRKKIDWLKKELEQIGLQRDVRRKGRKEFKKAALVGYTNAGKSLLMNALADSDLFVEDRLFATLDASIRAFRLTDRERALLIDTVGFIRKLPHHLVASFRSTLEETVEADLLLHVVDASRPRVGERISVVQDVLKDLRIEEKPIVLVFNKIDLFDDRRIVPELMRSFPGAVFVSALKGIGIETLRQAVSGRLSEAEVEGEARIPVERSRDIAALHSLAKVTGKTYEDGMAVIRYRAEPRNASKIRALLSGDADKDEAPV